MFRTPPVVKNLILLNILFFVAQTFLPNGIGDKFTDILALHSFSSPLLEYYQIVTHMFMHANITHLFTNMFALWMFGRILEYDLGNKRFLIYYMITGMGAAVLHMGVGSWEIHNMVMASKEFINTPTPELFDVFIKEYLPAISSSSIDSFLDQWYSSPANSSYINEAIGFINQIVDKNINIPTVGASGAVFGILLAFGMMHPNERIMLLIPPIPMKAKYFVMIYGALELYLGVSQGSGSQIAHFAHIGGMLWGFILLYYWRKRGDIYY